MTELECDDMPSVSEETLKRVAEQLKIDEARLFVLAERTPRELAPETETEYALYRKVKAMKASPRPRSIQPDSEA